MKTTKIFSTICLMLMVSMIFQTVAAQIETYTIDNDGSSITITTGQRFNVSVQWTSMRMWLLVGYDFVSGDYNSSVLDIVDVGFWEPDDLWAPKRVNLTFEGISAGSEVVTYNHQNWINSTIYDTFTLNVTVNASDQSVNLPLMLIVLIIIAVVPSAIIIKWMKGEESDEK